MKTFVQFIKESKLNIRKIGKTVSPRVWVHKNYVDQSVIPKDVHDTALKVLKEKYPDYNYDIVRYDKKTNDMGFIQSPNFDSAPEPTVGDSVTIKPSGEHKFNKAGQKEQIYHQKETMVGDDYTGFDVNKSKTRTERYQAALKKLADENGVSTKHYTTRMGYKDFWDKEIVPHIKED